MNAVILQPSYIPWRGYFHQIRKADVFVFLDDVQFDKRGWRNRNKVAGPHGAQWLTIPVEAKGAIVEAIPIKDIGICWDRPWNTKHLATLRHVYARAPHFGEYIPLLERLYEPHYELLADFVIDVTIALARAMGIRETRFVRSSALASRGVKSERLLAILAQIGATHYISGPSARSYIEPEKFAEAGITLEYMEYVYPAYPQLYPPFDPHLSILDLLFMVGSDAPKYIWETPPLEL